MVPTEPGDPPEYVALSGLIAYAGATPALIVARKSADPEQRVVIAMSEPEARWLHGVGRLHGWTPNETSVD